MQKQGPEISQAHLEDRADKHDATAVKLQELSREVSGPLLAKLEAVTGDNTKPTDLHQELAPEPLSPNELAQMSKAEQEAREQQLTKLAQETLQKIDPEALRTAV